jgi:hypothetical protein
MCLASVLGPFGHRLEAYATSFGHRLEAYATLVRRVVAVDSWTSRKGAFETSLRTAESNVA